MTKIGFLFISLILFAANIAWADPVVVKIGATLPLTGRLAIAGQDARQGIELAIQEFSSPTVKLEAVFDDNQHDAKLAVSSARKLFDFDNVNVLISMWDMADVVAPLAEKHKVPHLAVRWNPHITEKYKYTFTFESTYRSYVDSLIALLKKTNVNSIAIITEESQGWILSADYLLSKAPEFGIKVAGDERYVPGGTDFRTTILRAIKNKPEMVVLLRNPPYTEMIIKQIQESAPSQKFTGYFEIIDPTLVNGIPFVAQFDVKNWFTKRFSDRYGTAPRSRAPQMYDMVHLVSLATSSSGILPTPNSIVDALKILPSGSGATGELLSSVPRVVESRCVWKVARNAEFVLYR